MGYFRQLYFVDLVLLIGVRVLLVMRFINFRVGNASDLLSSVFTIEQRSSLFKRTVLGLDDV